VAQLLTWKEKRRRTICASGKKELRTLQRTSFKNEKEKMNLKELMLQERRGGGDLVGGGEKKSPTTGMLTGRGGRGRSEAARVRRLIHNNRPPPMLLYGRGVDALVCLKRRKGR